MSISLSYLAFMESCLAMLQNQSHKYEFNGLDLRVNTNTIATTLAIPSFWQAKKADIFTKSQKLYIDHTASLKYKDAQDLYGLLCHAANFLSFEPIFLGQWAQKNWEHGGVYYVHVDGFSVREIGSCCIVKYHHEAILTVITQSDALLFVQNAANLCKANTWDYVYDTEILTNKITGQQYKTTNPYGLMCTFVQ